MRIVLNASIELDVADPREATAFEQNLSTWLHQQQAVRDATVSGSSVGNTALWRQSRTAAFGPRLRSPFARQRAHEA
ncbi:hypothetical protein [Azospirillum sp. SYSU D00513]|uniref:hypothetical protein n=1 Tax=Azospirillum sp. SYSU D00513 TaxID=2812561 RepID=UPI001A974689|nr:hypothetical protein [Azospirillum sp. SYSU D00513]